MESLEHINKTSEDSALEHVLNLSVSLPALGPIH